MSDDPLAFRLSTSPYSSVEGNRARTPTGRDPDARTPIDESPVPPAGKGHAPARFGPDTISRRLASEVLGRDQFLHALEREKRRADRSKSSLSVVRWDARGLELGQAAMYLVDMINASRRETDIVGDLGDGVVGALLPGTNEDGARVFVRKIAERTRDIRLLTTVTTYPDQAFDRIASGQAVADEAGEFLDETAAPRRVEDALKRMIDVVLSLALLAALTPLLLFTAIAIAVTSRGPVIFRQARLGKGGVPFDFYKFRSMRPSNDDSIHRAFVSSLIQGKHAAINQHTPANPLFKIKDDPRITTVGRFIRKTSIDELPQLFNVLKGDMSLVGPRPPLPYEAEQYQSWHLRRILEVRPGITGMWQVEGRSRVSFDEMVRMDLRYIKRRSLALDIKLLLKTVLVVVAGRGAE